MSTDHTGALPESFDEFVNYGTEDEGNDLNPWHQDHSASEDTYLPTNQSETDHKNGMQSESDHNKSLSENDSHMDTNPGNDTTSTDNSSDTCTNHDSTQTDSQQTDSGPENESKLCDEENNKNCTQKHRQHSTKRIYSEQQHKKKRPTS
jgi:hypothetical protein